MRFSLSHQIALLSSKAPLYTVFSCGALIRPRPRHRLSRVITVLLWTFYLLIFGRAQKQNCTAALYKGENHTINFVLDPVNHDFIVLLWIIHFLFNPS